MKLNLLAKMAHVTLAHFFFQTNIDMCCITEGNKQHDTIAYANEYQRRTSNSVTRWEEIIAACAWYWKEITAAFTEETTKYGIPPS